MRPRRLEVDGFTAFRDLQTVDFSEFDLFVITGPTGAGKTSLLDAIALSLYGQVPRMGKHGLGQLVSHGKPEARILLEFSVDGDGYRVSRRLPRRGAQQGRFERWDGSRWADAVERGGIKPVNSAVLDLVKLDFESFCKAIVLPQGEFGRFLKGDPGERRQTLVTLLGLGVYERMGALARERAKELRIRGEQTRTILDEQFADATPAALEAAEAASGQAEAAAGRAAGALASARRADGHREEALKRAEAAGGLAARASGLADQLHGELKACRAAEEARTMAAASREKVQADADATAAQLATCETREAAVTERSGTPEELARLIGAATRREEHEQRVLTATEQLSAAAERQRVLATQAQDQSTRLGENEAALAESRETEAQARRDRDGLTSKRDELRRAMDLVDSAAERIRREERRVVQLTGALATAAATAEAAVGARDVATERLGTLQREHAVAHLVVGLGPDDACPVCERPLSEAPSVDAGINDRLKEAGRLAETAQGEADEAQAHHARTKADVEAATSRIAEAHEGLTVALAGHADEAALREQLESVGKAAVGADAALAEAISRREAAATVAQNAAVDLARARERLDAAADQHRLRSEALEQATSDREGALELLRQRFGDNIPADAGVRLEAARAELAGAVEATRSARRDEAAARMHLGEVERDVQEAARILGLIDVRLGELRARATETLDQATAVGDQMRLVALPQPDEARDRRAGELASWCRTAAAAMDGAKAGCEGTAAQHGNEIVAAATSLALPVSDASVALAVIEAAEQSAAEVRIRADEACSRLAERVEQRIQLETRISDDAAQTAVLDVLATELRADHFIDFVVQETLDVLAVRASEELLRISNGRYSLISDEGNFSVVDHVNADETRSVRTLSGGETFMASLSLALALSKHVSELAGEGLGARLEAVFIDEGFGSLDPETLEEVIDALERLREEDLLVGVISHVPALAERIQSGLRVVKDGNRSTTETVGIA